MRFGFSRTGVSAFAGLSLTLSLAVGMATAPTGTGLVPAAIAAPGDSADVPAVPLPDAVIPADPANDVDGLPAQLDDLPEPASEVVDPAASWTGLDELPVRVRETDEPTELVEPVDEPGASTAEEPGATDAGPGLEPETDLDASGTGPDPVLRTC